MQIQMYKYNASKEWWSWVVGYDGNPSQMCIHEWSTVGI